VDTLILGIAPEEGVLMGRPSKYPAEFREQAVELVRVSGKPIVAVARDLGVNESTLRNWIKTQDAERGVPDASGLLPLTAAERAELTRLRRENSKLKVEREILKKAAAFFVTESTR
jgi:transposase